MLLNEMNLPEIAPSHHIIKVAMMKGITYAAWKKKMGCIDALIYHIQSTIIWYAMILQWQTAIMIRMIPTV